MKLLVDTDFLVAITAAPDAHHDRATKIYQRLDPDTVLYVLSLVQWETATVLSYKVNHEVSKQFVATFDETDFMRIPMSDELESAAWTIFGKQTKKGTSFVDCANLAAVAMYKLDGILSFDTFYPKTVRKT